MDREDLLEEVIVYSSAPTHNVSNAKDVSNNNEDNDTDVSDDIPELEDAPETDTSEEPEDSAKEEDEKSEEDKKKEFLKIATDFLNDVKTTYPELTNKIDELNKDKEELLNYCKVVYPERFFDILYQNNDIFKEDSKVNTYFLPNIDFKQLWNTEGVSDKTKNVIWKYLQLILFNIVGELNNKDMFGDAANIFEAIDKTDFKDKLEETISQMGDMFKDSKMDNNIDEDSLPDTEKIHEHISGIMDGKLGRLAHEIAEDTAKDLNLEEDGNPEEVFQNLIKDPTKLMGLIKNVGSKLDSKMKSGSLNESELLSEATDIMNKMGDMPGMKNIQDLFKNFNMPGGNKKGKVNKSAFNNHMRRHKTKQDLKKKLVKKQSDQSLIEKNKQELDEATRRSEEMMNSLLDDLLKEETKIKTNKKKGKKKITK
uniref:Uncharacterized protein n=1 Tax=Megaviridae environmental sample TaxID=1737588 RepID=A0A5J6VMI3_9VIRU|nr:MAG: hypothetical protein [Megaviridae environmental sample]